MDLGQAALGAGDVHSARAALEQGAGLFAAYVSRLPNRLVGIWIWCVVSSALRLVLNALGEAASGIIHA